MIRYIVMNAIDYEGMWPCYAEGTDQEPLPTFATEEEALKWGSKYGVRKDLEILAVEIP